MGHGTCCFRALLLPLAAAVVHIPLAAQKGPHRGTHIAEVVSQVSAGTSNATILVASSWNAETAASDVTVRLHNLQTFYTASMEVGTPPVPVKMMVDSGSSNMWVKQRSEFGIMELDSVDSFELGPRPPPVHFQYGVGDVAGKAASGQVCLGKLCAQHQDFLLAQVINNIGNLQEFDGFLGLAFPQMLDVGRITFLQQLQRQGGFRNLGFALCLRGERGDSTLSLGEVEDLVQEARDKTGMPGLSLQVHGLERESELRAGLPGTLLFWMVPMNLRVKRFELLMDLAGFGILDSGTSLMLLSQKPYDETMEALTYGTFVDPHRLLDCETTNLNDLIVHFASGGRELEVRLESKDLLLPVAMSPEGRSMCRIGIGLIAASPPPLPSMILGDVFLRKVHVIHDMAGPTVTLVPDATGRAEPSQYYEGRAALKFDPSLASWLPALLLSSMGGYLAFVLCRVSGPYLPLQETTDDYIKL